MMITYIIICEHMNVWGLVYEHTTYHVFLVKDGWAMLKPKDEEEIKDKLICQKRAYSTTIQIQPFGKFTKPFKEWLATIETIANKILGNYITKEDRLLIEAFQDQSKRGGKDTNTGKEKEGREGRTHREKVANEERDRRWKWPSVAVVLPLNRVAAAAYTPARYPWGEFHVC